MIESCQTRIPEALGSTGRSALAACGPVVEFANLSKVVLLFAVCGPSYCVIADRALILRCFEESTLLGVDQDAALLDFSVEPA